MSTLVTLDFQTNNPKNLSRPSIVKSLLTAGWSFDYEGAAFLLPLGGDEYDWTRQEIDEKELFFHLERKVKSGEVIGLTLTWKQTMIGGEFLLKTDDSISMNLSINLRMTSSKIVDINWYLERLVPVLRQAGLEIICTEFQEVH